MSKAIFWNKFTAFIYAKLVSYTEGADAAFLDSPSAVECNRERVATRGVLSDDFVDGGGVFLP